MIGADNVLAQGDGGAIKHGQLPLRQENVGNVGAKSEQGGKENGIWQHFGLQLNGSKRVERWVEDGGETFLSFQSNTYIFQEVEDFIHVF